MWILGTHYAAPRLRLISAHLSSNWFDSPTDDLVLAKVYSNVWYIGTNAQMVGSNVQRVGRNSTDKSSDSHLSSVNIGIDDICGMKHCLPGRVKNPHTDRNIYNGLQCFGYNFNFKRLSDIENRIYIARRLANAYCLKFE